MRKILLVMITCIFLFCNLGIHVKAAGENFKLPTLMNLDEPNANSNFINKDVNIRGWAISESGLSNINIYLNDVFLKSINTYQSRADVSKVYPQYNNSIMSGFSYTLSKDNFKIGRNKVTVEVNGKNGDKINREIYVDFNDLEPKINLDDPSKSTMSYNKQIDIRGWALINSGVKEVKVILNNKLLGNANYGYERPDIKNVYPDYNNSYKSEYRYSIDKSNLVKGSNVLQIIAVGNKGEEVEVKKEIKIEDFDIKYNIDFSDYEITNNDVTVRGWAIDGTGLKSTEVYLNDKLMGIATLNNKRPDIVNVFPSYDDSENSGFTYNIRKDLLTDGKYMLKVKFTFNSGRVIESVKEFNYHRFVPMLVVDEPTSNTYTNVKDINVRGWSLNSAGVKQVKVYLNNKLQGDATLSIDRPDVYKVYPQYNNNKSGYSYSISKESLIQGNNKVTIEAIGNDGFIVKKDINLNINPLPLIYNLDEPTEEINDQNITVRGWALDGYGISDIKVYIDNNYAGDAVLGENRADIKEYYSQYVNSDKSGFKFQINKNTLKYGYHTLKVIINSGVKDRSQVIEKKIYLYKLKTIGVLDDPINNMSYDNDETIKIRGWALAYEGVKSVNVFVDEKQVGQANYGELREDVSRAYSQYNNRNSGYSYNLNLSNYALGDHSIKVIVEGNDGSNIALEKKINIKDFSQNMNIDEPLYVQHEGENIKVRGWAINYYGVKDVNVKVNGILIGKAIYGTNRPDLLNIYKEYKNSDKSGYELVLSNTRFNKGKNVIEVEVIGNDGKITSMKKEITIQMKPYMNIDELEDNSIIKSQTIIRGWGIFEEGVKEVNIYIDNNLIGKASYGISRPDVRGVYPNYTNSDKSGFEYTLDPSKYNNGDHEIKVEVVSNLGDKIYSSKNIKISRALIVVDPGHDYGKDFGAVGTHNGIKYEETVLNMQVAVKLKASLEAKGYTVILTRQLWDKPMSDSAAESLKARANLANGLNADLFISIHHDSSTSSSPTGVSTHYSSYRPSIDNSGIVVGNDPNGWYKDVNIDTTPSTQSIISKNLADKIVNNLSSQLGYKNNLSHDHNLYVTVNTNMPSVLVECGFLSNQSDAIRAADSNNQQRIADVIADSVKEMF